MNHRCFLISAALGVLLGLMPAAWAQDDGGGFFDFGGGEDAAPAADGGADFGLTPGDIATPSGPEAQAGEGVDPGDGVSDGDGVSLFGGYGFLPLTVSRGDARFRQRPFRFTVSLFQGYDDNVFSASDEQPKIPKFIEVQQINPVTGAVTTVRVRTPPQPERIGKVGSAVTNTRASAELRMTSPRLLLAVDVNTGLLYYWDRPIDSTDYEADIGGLVIYRVTPRLRFSGQVDVSFQSQPDFSRLNAPTRSTPGDYISANSRFDLTYDFTRRWQNVLSYSFGTLMFMDDREGDYYDNTIGNQVRYRLTPRLTAAGEYRYKALTYADNPDSDSVTHHFLLGGDWEAGPRLTLTGRAGEAIRIFEAGGSQSAPFLESAVLYSYQRHSSVQWSNRYGFEQSSSAAEERVSFRSGLQIRHVFSARSSVTFGLNYLHTIITNETAGIDRAEDVFQMHLAMQYILTRNFSLNATYRFTMLLSDIPFSDYTRNVVFLGGAFAF